jgi:hypothetical protein
MAVMVFITVSGSMIKIAVTGRNAVIRDLCGRMAESRGE